MNADGSVLLHRLAVEARGEIVTSHGTHRSRPLYVLSVEGPDRGFAEVVGLPVPAPGDPSIEEVVESLTSYVLPLLSERSFRRGFVGDPGSVRPSFNAERATAFACHAVEALLLDRWSRATRADLHEQLGGREGVALRRTWFIDAGVQAAPQPGDRIRAKVDAGNLLERARVLTEAYPEVEVALDANGCLADLDAGQLRELLNPLVGHDHVVLEQPLAHQDLVGHAELRGRGLRVYLDESAVSLAAVRAIARYEAADGVVLKPARLGGAIATVQALEECRGLGLQAGVGGMLESELGRCVLRVLASHPGATMAGDLGPSSDYLLDDPTATEGGEGDLGGFGVDPSAALVGAEQVAAFPVALGDPAASTA